MKFTSYYVSFVHNEASFQGRIFLDPHDYSAIFNRIGENLYILQFPSQVSLRLGNVFTLKKTGQTGTVLLPQYAKLNQRKLNKLISVIKDWDQKDPYFIIKSLYEIENFVELEPIRNFFELNHKALLDWVNEQSVASHLFLMDTHQLMVCSHETVALFTSRMEEQIRVALSGTENTVRFSDLEVSCKLPADSRLFRYIIAKLKTVYGGSIMKDCLLLGQNELSDTDRSMVKELQGLLKKHKLLIFSLDDLIETKALPLKQLNDMLWALVEKGDVTRLSEKYFIFEEDLAKIVNRLKKHKRNVSDEIDIKTIREITQLTRKHIITLFEYFDEQNITRRVENHRQILLTV